MELIPPLFIKPYLSLQAVWRRSVILPASFAQFGGNTKISV